MTKLPGATHRCDTGQFRRQQKSLAGSLAVGPPQATLTAVAPLSRVDPSQKWVRRG